MLYAENIFTVQKLLNWLKIMTTMTMIIIVITRTPRERKPSPVPKFETKVIHDLNLDFRINLDPDVHRICPKMLCMHYLVDVSHFDKYGTNWL